MDHLRNWKNAALASVAMLGVAMAAPVLAAPNIGAPAPDFTGVDTKGTPHKLSDLKGKVVVLEWTNDGCPFVQKHYGTHNMQNTQKAATDKGVVWLSVISSPKGEQGYVTGPEADKLTQSRDAHPTAVLLDPEGKIGRLYEAKTTPHMYIVDKDGKLAYMGGIDDKPSTKPEDVKTAKNYVLAALDSVESGKPVAQAVTRPYGCSVKYN